jgi:hypothetical protein
MQRKCFPNQIWLGRKGQSALCFTRKMKTIEEAMHASWLEQLFKPPVEPLA